MSAIETLLSGIPFTPQLSYNPSNDGDTRDPVRPSLIERGLVKSGRLVRLRIPLPDHPGALHQLTNVIASQRVNIVETNYHRAFYGASIGHTVIDLTVETRGPEHSDELIGALSEAGYHHERIV